MLKVSTENCTKLQSTLNENDIFAQLKKAKLKRIKSCAANKGAKLIFDMPITHQLRQ